MDESAQMSSVLSQVRALLPAEIWHTCDSLNSHGEWEMALSHCVHHLAAVRPISPFAKNALEACALRFHSSNKVLISIAEL